MSSLLRMLLTLALVQFASSFVGISPIRRVIVAPYKASTVRPATRSPTEVSQARRKVLLSRTAPHFTLKPFQGEIEFGSTINLVTRLAGGNPDTITDWLRDEKSLALSIWDPKMTTDKGGNVYRLQTAPLQFVTLKLSPWVDVRMKTVEDRNKQPVFQLDSVAFDPNIEFLPGMNVNAQSLGIVIEVAGLLRPNPRSPNSVAGCISFQTSGQLPPPLRLVPEPVLKLAAETISNTIKTFAVRSFEQGAKSNFETFLRHRKANQQKEGTVANE